MRKLSIVALLLVGLVGLGGTVFATVHATLHPDPKWVIVSVLLAALAVPIALSAINLAVRQAQRPILNSLQSSQRTLLVQLVL